METEHFATLVEEAGLGIGAETIESPPGTTWASGSRSNWLPWAAGSGLANTQRPGRPAVGILAGPDIGLAGAVRPVIKSLAREIVHNPLPE